MSIGRWPNFCLMYATCSFDTVYEVTVAPRSAANAEHPPQPQARAAQLVDGDVELRCGPPAVDVRLAEAERTVAQYARPHPIVVHGYVPRPIAADADVGVAEAHAVQVARA